MWCCKTVPDSLLGIQTNLERLAIEGDSPVEVTKKMLERVLEYCTLDIVQEFRRYQLLTLNTSRVR